MTPCLITPLAPADLERARELAAISGSGFDPAAELARPWARIWVARTELYAAPVAWALVWRAADEAHLLDLAVDPAARRGGVGRALLTHVVDAVREDGATVALLEVRASNAPAIGLYRSVGFSETSVRRAYYSDNGEDAIVMRLVLINP